MAVRFPLVPILAEAAKATQTVSPDPTVLTVFPASVNLMLSHLPCTHMTGLPCSGQPDDMPGSTRLGLLPLQFEQKPFSLGHAFQP